MKFRLCLPVLFSAALMMAGSAFAQQKPLSQDQVLGLVRNNLGDESGAKLVEQRGLDFQPSDEFLGALRRAGASEAFIKAVGAARSKALSAPAASKPLNTFQLLELIANDVPSQRVAMLVEERGVDFKPGEAFLEAIEMAGAGQTLLQTLRQAQPVRAPGATTTPAEEAAKAEQEFRTALKAEPAKPALHLFLGYALGQQQRLDEAVAEYREALRLKPSFVAARIYLGTALTRKRDFDGAIGEYREAMRLDPKSPVAHTALANALAAKGDLAGATAECRQALRLDANNVGAHIQMSYLMGRQGDVAGQAAEAREALRLDPNNVVGHNNLGHALRRQGNLDGAIRELREALSLNPDYALAHENLGLALGQKGDPDGALAEYREAVRLDPKRSDAHLNLGYALYRKKDLDGAIAEFNEALRIDPNFAVGHFNLGLALEAKQDRQSALEQYRLAANLAPDAGAYRQNYERLSRELQNPGPTADSSGTIYTVGRGVGAPVALYRPNPPYSEEARRAKLHGTVGLEVVINSQGNVADVRVSKPLEPGLDKSAVETVRTWKFKPAKRNGMPVAVRVSIEIGFHLY